MTSSDVSTSAPPATLTRALREAADRLRPAEVIMQPERLGAVRLTRYSFNRMLLRRAAIDGWKGRRVRFDIDGEGGGEAAYELDMGSHVATFVAFTRVLDESEHTDRVIANRWEITACLVDGPATPEVMSLLRSEIPKQEAGRLDGRVLVLTRGNRSVRFFQYLVDCLASGQQPDPERVADAGYIMRSTAFYGNGKYGMRSFAGYSSDHPLRVSYRAQFACAWLFREMSFDIVEHCAREQATRNGTEPAAFDDEWRRFFGLGNATGLGLVPYAFKHPRIMNAWVGIRELALAGVRDLSGSSDRLSAMDRWLERATTHLRSGTSDDCTPFLSPAQLIPTLEQITDAWAVCRSDPKPFDSLYRWAHAASATTHGAEREEWVVSLLLELSEVPDETVDEWLTVEEGHHLDDSLTVGRALDLLRRQYRWVDDLDLESAEADAFWWVISDNTEEPRRARRARLAPEGRDVAIDVALRLARLRVALQRDDAGRSLASFAAEWPEHRLAIRRLATAGDPYAEPRDNACGPRYLPLQLQRFQLAQYGMDNYKPKSTDWLRVTLFQGAPRLRDLNDEGAGMSDDWVLPARPGAAS